MPLPNVVGTVTADPTDPHDLVTKRTVSVVLDGAAPVVVDMTAGPVTFPCLIGQAYTINDVDTNAIGDSLPATITGTVPSFATVPKTPTGLAVTFAPAP